MPQQAQSGISHQMFGVRADFGGELCELCFLVRCEMHFHTWRLLEMRRTGKLLSRESTGDTKDSGASISRSPTLTVVPPNFLGSGRLPALALESASFTPKMLTARAEKKRC